MAPLSQGQFREALDQLTKAHRLARMDTFIKQDYESALLANREYDRLLEGFATVWPGANLASLFGQLRIYALKGDKAENPGNDATAPYHVPEPGKRRPAPILEPSTEMILYLNTDNVAGYLAQAAKLPRESAFEPLLLQGKLEEAAEKVKEADEITTRIRRRLTLSGRSEEKPSCPGGETTVAFIG